jgi:hypothetical protein
MSSHAGQKVELALSLSTSPPHTISVNEPSPGETLKFIAKIQQTASPFPDRAVTILTKYSCLEVDTPVSGGAFFTRAMASPKVTVQDDECPAPELPMRPVGKWITITHMSGDPNLLKRSEEDPAFKFVTIPAIGHGHAEVVWELPPSKLLQRLGNKNDSLEEKMKRFLRPGDTYKILPENLRIPWWTFGSLRDERGDEKKVARWSFPGDLPLTRDPADDETEETAHRLCDGVDLHNVNKLSSRSAVDDEPIPKIGKMRGEGWIFGEPNDGLEMRVENDGHKAQFTIV